MNWPQSIVEIDTAARMQKLSGNSIDKLWETHDFLAGLFAGRYRGSGRPFINHLAGTAGLALLHGCSDAEILAGYAHAAYEQGEFGRVATGASKINRRSLRAVIGEEAEALVFQYGEFDWLVLLEQHSAGGLPPLTNSQQSLLLLRVFNELDDSMDCSAYATRWCRQCLHRLELGAELADTLGRNSVAEQIHSQVDALSSSGVIEIDGVRRKKSTTISNPAYKPRRLLKLARRSRSLFYKLRDRLMRR